MTPATLRSLASAFAASSVLVVGWSSGLAAAQTAPVVINLSAQNNSGLSGTATLTDIGGGKTRVQLRITGPEGDYPAHIHMGTCANLNPAPQYPLINVRDGQSTTDVDASLATIQQSPHAINLHKSAEEIATYVACGDIAVAGASTAPAAPATAPSPAPAPGSTGLANAPRARDGQSLATQTPATQATFIAVWGDRAATEWVTEHNAALPR
jgi:hypothetical protein